MDIPLNERSLLALVREMRKRDHFLTTNFPAYLGNKRHEPHLKLANELVEECEEYLAAMDLDEIESARERAAVWVRFSDWNNPLVSIEKKKRYLAEGYVQAELRKRFMLMDEVVNGGVEGSLVFDQYPELVDHMDDDGLLILSDVFEPVDGAILYKDHALNYHQFLRRAFTSRPNYDFLVPFTRYYRDTNQKNTFRIAIDHTRLMRREDYVRTYEFDSWFGPPFDEDKLDDPNEVGLTVVGRNKTSLFELSNHLHFTDFLWTYKDGIKSLQIEEVHDEEDALEGYVVNRYVHSERDTELGIFRHLDGAVKVYKVSSYDTRRSSHLPEARECYRKPKLWRIDGEIDFETWSSLISLFYKSNETIIEYFNPEAFEMMFELRIRDPERWKANQAAGESS